MGLNISTSRPLALIVAAMLVAYQPATSTAAPLAIHIHSEHAMFQVLISPGTVGSDRFVLQLMSGEGSLLQVREATLYLSLPARGIEPLARRAELGADGYWHVPNVPIRYPGRWHVRIDALTDQQKITLEDDFDVPASPAAR